MGANKPRRLTQGLLSCPVTPFFKNNKAPLTHIVYPVLYRKIMCKAIEMLQVQRDMFLELSSVTF